MQQNKNTPSIRFAGFTDAWEQRKLGAVYQKIRNAFVGTATPFYVKNGHFYLESNNVKNGEINRNSEVFINDAFYEKQRENWLHSGDIVMVQSGHVGHSAVIPDELDNTAAHALIIIANPNVEISPYFVNIQFQSPTAVKRIEHITTGNTIKHILASDMKQFEILVPEHAEQVQISQLFEKLGSLITLHQRKYDQLVNIKKSMLEKMFPKNGELVPEVRFAGFTDAWEQRKLSTYLVTSNEKNTEERFTRDDVLSVSGDFGIVNQIEFQGRSFAGASVVNYGVVEKGDVVYTKSPLSSNPYGIIKTNKGKAGIVSTLYAVYHPHNNVSSDFVQTYFEQNARVNNYLQPLVNKGAKNDMKVSADNALKGIVCFPDYEEQNRISRFFTKLDDLITLHQRKLERLQNIKKACLEKMFV